MPSTAARAGAFTRALIEPEPQIYGKTSEHSEQGYIFAPGELPAAGQPPAATERRPLSTSMSFATLVHPGNCSCIALPSAIHGGRLHIADAAREVFPLPPHLSIKSTGSTLNRLPKAFAWA